MYNLREEQSRFKGADAVLCFNWCVWGTRPVWQYRLRKWVVKRWHQRWPGNHAGLTDNFKDSDLYFEWDEQSYEGVELKTARIWLTF